MLETLLIIAGLVALVALVVSAVVDCRHRKQLQAVIADLREQLEIERQVAGYDQQVNRYLERQLQKRRNFLGTAASQLLTPLNALQGFAGLLVTEREELAVQDDDMRRQLARQLVDSARQLTTMVNKLVEVTRYDSLSSLRVDDGVELNSLCRELLHGYEHQVAAGVALYFTSVLHDDTLVATNREALSRLLGHLLDNAVGHTAEGSVTLAVEVPRQREWLELSVADTGTGIDPSRQRSIFELLSDTVGDATADGASLHLGLPISRSIARLLGGSVTLDNTYKHGARFVVRIPFKLATPS